MGSRQKAKTKKAFFTVQLPPTGAMLIYVTLGLPIFLNPDN
jgi:hypothetical protein